MQLLLDVNLSRIRGVSVIEQGRIGRVTGGVVQRLLARLHHRWALNSSFLFMDREIPLLTLFTKPIFEMLFITSSSDNWQAEYLMHFFHFWNNTVATQERAYVFFHWNILYTCCSSSMLTPCSSKMDETVSSRAAMRSLRSVYWGLFLKIRSVAAEQLYLCVKCPVPGFSVIFDCLASVWKSKVSVSIHPAHFQQDRKHFFFVFSTGSRARGILGVCTHLNSPLIGLVLGVLSLILETVQPRVKTL